jgi:uncharacterized protein YbjT (DUF2867 family)
MIAIMGATGNTGRPLAEALLSQRERVRAIGRDRARLQPLVARGAEAFIADPSDPDSLAHAFEGAEVAYTLIPPRLDAPDVRAFQDRVGEATATALKRSGVRRVVFLSSQGAHQPKGTGPIAGLHAQERRLERLGVDALFLRPGYFHENVFANLGMIKHQGMNGGAIAADAPLNMTATRDIGEAAARAILNRDWNGIVVRDLLGPRTMTMAEVTRIVGEAIGRPDLSYVQFPYDAFAGALTQAGLSKDVARLYAEMARAVNEGLLGLPERTPQNTTPTPFEALAPALARAYAQA